MYLASTYQPPNLGFTHGQGIWLYDSHKTAYLDGFCGIAVTGLGHAHPMITKVIQTQAEKLLHTSNAFRIFAQEALAERLSELTKMKESFFCNSGSEANETAFKLARLYGHTKGVETPAVIVMENAFHGRTLAALTAGGNRKHQAGFEPLVPGFIRARYNDIQALHTIAQNRNDVVAVMLEPIQGEGGIQVADESYLHAVESLCQSQGWLFMCDEVQTGNARTGSLFASLGLGLKPDVITTAKGLGNGVPIGACMMQGLASGLFQPGSHGSTFGGNPLACAVAHQVLDIIIEENLCEQTESQGMFLKQVLIDELSQHPNVRAIRGRGLMLGIELDQPATPIKSIGIQEGLLLNVTAQNVVRLLPPLIMTDQDVQRFLEKLIKTFNRFGESS